MAMHVETFETRKRYNGPATEFLDRLLMLVPLFVVAAFIVYPLGFVQSPQYTFWGYVLFNVGLIGVSAIKIAQKYIPLRSTFRLEILATAAVSLGGCSMITYVVGFQHFFVVFWLIPAIYAYLQFAVPGFVFLVAILWAMAGVDALRSDVHSTEASYYLVTLMYLTTLNIIAYVIIKVLDFSKQSQYGMEVSKLRETDQRTQLQAVLDNMSEALITVTKTGVIDLQNNSVESVLSTTRLIVGEYADDVFRLIDEKDNPVTIKELLSHRQKAVYRDDLRHKVSDGEYMNLSIHITPIKLDHDARITAEVERYVMVFRNITKQKTLDYERDEFISVMSHELRTPVAIARGSIENWLAVQDKGGKTAVTRKSAEVAHDHVKLLASIIDDLSNLSRVERGVGSEAEEVELSSLTKDLYESFEQEANRAKLKLVLDLEADLPVVHMSKTYLNQILKKFPEQCHQIYARGLGDVICQTQW